VVGTILNAAGIAFGGAVGLATKKQLSPARQRLLKLLLGVTATYFGLRLTCLSLSGSLGQVLKQIIIVLLALILGKIAGQLLRLQEMSNRIGQTASAQINQARDKTSANCSHGFNTCTLLYCIAPLAIIGAVQDGLSGCFQVLAIKAVMDGLAAMGFVRLFGWSTLFSALPVFVWQGTITLLCAQFARPFLEERALLESVNATSGLLLVFVAVVIFEVRKVALADYLPGLILAPLLTWLWH
jgi:uncharacterized protein